MTALTLGMMGNEGTHSRRSRVVTPGAHTLYSDTEWVANRLGLICLITESPMRSSEALWGIEMFPKISFGDNLGLLSFDFSAFSCR